MGVGPAQRCAAGGRFLTMHKRRRKRLHTRQLARDVAILDDVHHGHVQKILDRCGKWAFNAFTLETVAGGRSLPVLCVHLFHWYGLLHHFHLDVVRVWKLFTLIEEGYHNTNPYHNSIHATDVTQAMHCFLQQEKIKRHLTPLEVMASLIGAVAHDLDHPGVNQQFLITTSNHLAILYQNSSVLENHHWRSAVGCLIESGVTDQLAQDVRRELEEQIRELILATDMNRQNEFLTKFRKHLDENTLDLRRQTDRQFILQISLKCADISNPTRPWDISHKWSLKVCDEFFRQGEFERKLNLPVTSICDRQSMTIPKIQIGFFKLVVTPLFSEWHRFLKSRLSTHMMHLLEQNRRRWEEQERVEQAEETQTELSDAEDVQQISEPDGEGEESIATPTKRSSNETTPSVHDYYTPPQPPSSKEKRRQSLAVPTLESLGVRRHSVPVNLASPTSPRAPVGVATSSGLGELPRTIYRRESLPAAVRPVGGQPTSAGRSPLSPQAVSRASSGLREEDELLSAFLSRYGSQSSIISSGGSPHHSSTADDQPERPLSAENLLPEPSIASMTPNAAVSRLTTVMQGGAPMGGLSNPSGGGTKCLTRQQTFPPPQPYVRVRYMSATAEMTTCPELQHEGDSVSNSSQTSTENISSSRRPSVASPSQQAQQQQPQQHPSYPIPAIAVLSPNNSRPPDVLLPAGAEIAPKGGGAKRGDAGPSDKAVKMVRLEGTTSAQAQKENVDPRRLPPPPNTSLSRRRGSAPVSLPLARSQQPEDVVVGPPAGVGLITTATSLRRGSVPVEVAHYITLGDESPLDQHQLNITPVETSRTFWQYQRRGSAPVDLPPTGGAGLTRHVSLNGKAGRGRKKQLRRRSSDGPESCFIGETIAGDLVSRLLLQHRRPSAPPPIVSNAEAAEALLLARRRGSLPVEVLTVGHSVF